jgi:hypothetical protein
MLSGRQIDAIVIVRPSKHVLLKRETDFHQPVRIGYDNGFNKTASIRLKIAVFTPMPKATTNNPVAVNPGDFRSNRNVYRRCFSKGIYPGIVNYLERRVVALMS